MAPTSSTAPTRRVPHPVYGRNWTYGSDAEPGGLLSNDPRYGDAAELVTRYDPAVYDAVAEAAPGEGLTFDGFWNLSLNRYLAALGMTHSDLHNLAARAYLAEIGRPVADGDDDGDDDEPDA